jgi:hypothetical protein
MRNVSIDPVGQFLTPLGFNVAVVAGTQYADKDLDLANLARFRIDDGERLTGVIDKDLLARFVGQPHRRIQPLGPLAIEGAELAVTVPSRMFVSVLDPQQTQGDTLLAQFGVNP